MLRLLLVLSKRVLFLRQRTKKREREREKKRTNGQREERKKTPLSWAFFFFICSLTFFFSATTFSSLERLNLVVKTNDTKTKMMGSRMAERALHERGDGVFHVVNGTTRTLEKNEEKK